jgi:chemotaxis protein histidine kinase CheA
VTQSQPHKQQQGANIRTHEETDDSLLSRTAEVMDHQEHTDDSNPYTSTQQSVKMHESIKIDSGKLDELIDAIGEMVIIESMIKQDPALTTIASSGLLQNISQMDKITRELQQLAMSLRMIPVKATFQKMARVVPHRRPAYSSCTQLC